MDAIAPARAAQWQARVGFHLPIEKASLPQESSESITTTLRMLTRGMPGFTVARESLIAVDGDGYIEDTHWVQTNQATLAIDMDDDGRPDASDVETYSEKLRGKRRKTDAGVLDACQQAEGAANKTIFKEAA